MISTASTSAASAASSGIVRPDHRLQAGDSRRVRGASAVTGKASPAAIVGDRASAREPAAAGQAAEDGVGYRGSFVGMLGCVTMQWAGVAWFVLKRITAHRHGLAPGFHESA